MGKSLKNKRFHLFVEQDEKCIYCGFPMCYTSTKQSAADNRLSAFCSQYGFKDKFVKKMLICTVDHVVPKTSGGTHCNNNLVAAHSYCNSKKQDLSFDKFVLISDIQILAGTHTVMKWFSNSSKIAKAEF